MGNFSFLSPPDSSSSDEAAVEELLSQAIDHSVLQQVAAINRSSFPSDSVLPTHLETRFRRLNSLPANLHAKANPSSSSFNSHFSPIKSLNPQFDHRSVEVKPLSQEHVRPKKEEALNPKSGSAFNSSPSRSSNSSAGNADFEEIPHRKMDSASKSRSRSFASPSPSPSPPKNSGCFWCSPKRVSRKKSKENQMSGVGVNWGRRDDEELLSDLGILSEKEQQKILKKAMKEEEKINRQAEKIVKWAKQASARMNVSDIEEELADVESPR